MNISRKTYLKDTSFLLNNVIKTGVITHASAFKHLKPEQFDTLIEKAFDFAEKELKPLNRIGDINGTSLSDGQTMAPEEFTKVWKKLVDQDWLKICLPVSDDGLGFPDVIGAVIGEIFMMFNVSFALYYILTLESARLIEQHGSETTKTLFGKNLIQGHWAGSCSFALDHSLEAVPKDTYHSMTGDVQGVIGGDHDITENIVQILPARIKLDDKHSYGLFAVSKRIDSDGKLEDNHVVPTKKHATMGIRGISVNNFSYGSEGVCRGVLLKTFDSADDFITECSSHLLIRVALMASSKLSNITELSKSEVNRERSIPESKLVLHDYSSATFNVSIKADYSGLRAALLSASFSGDCGQHGGESQRNHFIELNRSYAQIMKVYAIKRAMRRYQEGFDLIGMHGYVSEHSFEQYNRDLISGCFLGLDNAFLKQQLIGLLKSEHSQMVESLIDEFQHIDPMNAKSDAMKETIGIWQDYLGGLILLQDDCRQDKEGQSWNRFADRWSMFLGDVIVCYHLILQGLEAEKEMKKEEVNFFNLDSELGKNREMKQMYDKILMAFHFAKVELALQDSQIRVMQEKEFATID